MGGDMNGRDTKGGHGGGYDLAVIGGGPGGYVAAIRAAQLGLKTVLAEKESVGGVCMNWGCIPTKFLLSQTKTAKDASGNKNLEGAVPGLNWEKVQEEKDRIVSRLVKGTQFLLERNGVEVLSGEACLEKGGISFEDQGERRFIAADKTILATGSKPANLPFLQADGERVLSSRQALSLRKVPVSIIIIGAGAIGLEMATIFNRMGSEVKVLEMMDTVLPGSDREMAARLERVLKKQKTAVFTRMRIDESRFTESGVELSGLSLKTEKPFRFEAEVALLAVGRAPNSPPLGKDLPQLNINRAGFVCVDEFMQTSIPGAYAIGDLVGGQLLAHKASHEGIVAAEHAAGLGSRMEYHAVPAAVFTDPEYASVGISQEQAESEGRTIKTGTFSLQACGRAVTMGETDGLVKLIADKRDRIIGAHILAPHAGDLIPELTLAVNKGLRLEDVYSTMHIHPTLSESMAEAAMEAQGRAIHMINSKKN